MSGGANPETTSGGANPETTSGGANPETTSGGPEAVAAAGSAESVGIVRVERGNPSDAELAALVAVLTAGQGGSAVAGDHRPRDLWGSPVSLHRVYAPYSPYSYAASGRHRR